MSRDITNDTSLWTEAFAGRHLLFTNLECNATDVGSTASGLISWSRIAESGTLFGSKHLCIGDNAFIDILIYLCARVHMITRAPNDGSKRTVAVPLATAAHF
jgi:hypothetical protein